MKKLFTGILATLAILACASACNGSNKGNSDSDLGSIGSGSVSSEDAESLETSAEFLESLYKNDGNKQTRTDYTVLSEINGYPIAWSVNVTEGVSVNVSEDGKTVTIKISKTLKEDLSYVLTATITDPATQEKEEVTFKRIALAAPSLFPQPITEAPKENTPYKLYVYNANASKIKEQYYNGKVEKSFYFGVTADYNEAVDVYVEYLEGSTTEFYPYFMNKDVKTYIGIVEARNTKYNRWSYNPQASENPVSKFTYSETHKTIVTELLCHDTDAEDSTTTTKKTFFFGNHDSYNSIESADVSKIDTNNVGGLVEMVSVNEIPAATKVANVKDALDVQLKHTMDKNVTLTTSDERYGDVEITWSVAETTYATVQNDKLALTIPEAEATVALTATITCGNVSDTKLFTLTLGPKTVAPAASATAQEIVEAAFKLAENETLGNYTLSGKITKVDTAYDSQYGNVTVTISVENKSIQCYRLKGTGADTIKVGDTITVTGTIKNYNGSVQFDSGCSLDKVETGSTGGGEVPPPPVAGDNDLQENVAYYAVISPAPLNENYYLTGEMSAYYYATTTDVTKAISVYAEQVTDGYKFFINKADKKYYLNIVASRDYTNAVYQTLSDNATPSVFSYNATKQCWEMSLNGEPCYLGTYTNSNNITFNTVGAYKSSYITDDTLNVTQFPMYFVKADGVEKPSFTADEKIAAEKTALENALEASYTGAQEITLATSGKTHKDVAIAWAVVSGSEIASIENGVLKITNPAESTKISVKATLTCEGGNDDEITFNITVEAKKETPDTPVQSSIKLTVDNLNIPSNSYRTETTTETVDGVSFSFIQIGNYGDGLQWRTKKGTQGALWNTTALAGNIEKIVFTANEKKLADATKNKKYSIKFGNTVACESTSMEVTTDTTNGNMTIVPNGKYTYFHIEHANNRSQYFTSIEIFYVAADTSETIADGVTKKDNTYFLSNANGLAWFNDQVNKEGNTFEGMTVELTADIDLESKLWTPVGQTLRTEFLGTFDGKNHTISNLAIDEAQLTLPTTDDGLYKHYGVGFFGWLDGTVKNVTFDNATVKGHHNVAVIVGYLQTGSIENCHVTNSTVANTHDDDDRCGDKAGMIVGLLNGTSSLKNSSATDCTVSGGRDAGQLVGAKSTTAAIDDCTATKVEVSVKDGCTGANIKNELCGREY